MKRRGGQRGESRPSGATRRRPLRGALRAALLAGALLAEAAGASSAAPGSPAPIHIASPHGSPPPSPAPLRLAQAAGDGTRKDGGGGQSAFVSEGVLPGGPQGGRERIVADLDQNRVAITAGFDGSEIFVFGAVKRTGPEPASGPLGVVVTLIGPPEKIVVRRKERVKGLWINRDSLVIEAAPSFYALATNGPLGELVTAEERLRYRIGIRQQIFSLEGIAKAAEAAPFIEALIRLQERKGVYRLLEGAVQLSEATLFHARIPLPANLTEGDYEARIFLTRGGQVVDRAETVIPVHKVGLERWIWRLAHERPLSYGILAIVLAALTGWIAATFFALLRR